MRIQYKCLVPIYVVPEMRLLFPNQNYNDLSPSSYTHISVRDLYISRIGLPRVFECYCNAKVAKVLDSIPASPDTVESTPAKFCSIISTLKIGLMIFRLKKIAQLFCTVKRRCHFSSLEKRWRYCSALEKDGACVLHWKKGGAIVLH